MELHERIALARKQAGLSQEQLGEKLGVSRQAISKWESGQTNPDVSYIASMCRLFGVSSDWLILGEENAQAAAPARCPKCQNIVTGLEQFCPNCGCNLKAPEEPTYTMVLRSENYSPRISAVLSSLASSGFFPPDSLMEQCKTNSDAIEHIPCILARGLSLDTVEKIQKKVKTLDGYFLHSFAYYKDSDGDTIEDFADKRPINVTHFAEPDTSLSFPMIVLAVVLGIIIVSIF